MRTNSVRLPNGIKLNYNEFGKRSDIPVLFLHGWTDSMRSYDLVLSHLPSSINTISISLRGHGDSDRPSEGYNPSDFSADIAAFLDELNIKSAVVAGHSMGSTAAQRFAIDYPERVPGIIMAGTSLTWYNNPVLCELWQTVSKFKDPIDQEFVREFQGSSSIPKEFLEIIISESLKVPAQVWKAALKGLIKTDFSNELVKIKAPALIVWGNQDPMTSLSDQESLARKLIKSNLIEYPEAGHNLHWEKPKRFAMDTIAFLKEII